MSEEMRSFGYLCPKCGKTVMAARSVFALEAKVAERTHLLAHCMHLSCETGLFH